MSINPFYVGTCENIANNERPIIFKPTLEEKPFEPFLIQDPFGLRKAVVPVFKRKINGEICGMGTAFHVDGWGTFLTADHVIEFAREVQSSASSWKDISQNPSEQPVLFLGMGLVYGSLEIPKESFAAVAFMASFLQERFDPLANLTGVARPKHAVDLSVMSAEIVSHPDVPPPHFIPVRASRWQPTIGETILAVGFPELECQRLEKHDPKLLLSEGMFGAYGRITKIHANGINQSNPSPVFEVECNWRSGMSGGPVFNSSGEVVGLVSRSLPPDNDLPGVGWATYFELIPNFNELVPTLDEFNPRWRRGWAVLKSTPEHWHLADFFKTEAEAQQLAESIGYDYEVKFGSRLFGTDNFVS